MAKWKMYTRSDGHVGFIHSRAEGTESLGIVRSDTPEDVVTRWVVDTERVYHGDILTFASGRQIVFLSDQIGVA